MRRLICEIADPIGPYYDNPYIIYENGEIYDSLKDNTSPFTKCQVVIHPSKNVKTFISYPMSLRECQQLIDQFNSLSNYNYFTFCKQFSEYDGRECDLQELLKQYMDNMYDDKFYLSWDYNLWLYDWLNVQFHNNIPVSYLMNYITEEMLATQIVNQKLGKPRKTDKDYKDIVRRYITKHPTLDDIDFEQIVEDNVSVYEQMNDDLEKKFGILREDTDGAYLNCKDADVIKYVQSFQPKALNISQDNRLQKDFD